MDFSAAVDALQAGKKVCRHSWPETHHIQIINVDVSPEYPNGLKLVRLAQFVNYYNLENAMITHPEWIIEGQDGFNSFADAIKGLKAGLKVSLKSWNNKAFLKYVRNDKAIYYYYWDTLEIPINAEDVLADDWRIFE